MKLPLDYSMQLKMALPFTTKEFLEVFRTYNQSIFPWQVIFLLMAATVILMLLKKTRVSNAVINIVLVFFWLWMGIVYHLIFFRVINPGAYLFGAFFIAQGLLFFYYGLIKKRLTYQFHQSPFKWISVTLIAFALVIYPLLKYVFGHTYPASPTFGLPCPTTIFTFGVLLCSDRIIPKVVLVIPFLWSVIGFSAAFQLGMREDVGLIVTGITVTALLLFRKRKLRYS